MDAGRNERLDVSPPQLVFAPFVQLRTIRLLFRRDSALMSHPLRPQHPIFSLISHLWIVTHCVQEPFLIVMLLSSDLSWLRPSTNR